MATIHTSIPTINQEHTVASTTSIPLSNQNASDLLRLIAWLSPVFPTGGFAYSAGLEVAFSRGTLKTATDLKAWLEAILEDGWAWNDLVLCTCAYQAHQQNHPLHEIQQTAEAIAGSAERYAETLATGASFRASAVSWPDAVTDLLPERCCLPVAIGSVAAASTIPLESALLAYAQSIVSNQIQAALRLAPIGQQKGVALLASLEEATVAAAQAACDASLDDLRSTSSISEIMSANHTQLNSRIFRS